MKLLPILAVAAGLLLSVPFRLVAAPYTFPGEGIVTDNSTGLSWQRHDDGTARLWPDALAYCEGLSLGGFDDWRLPDIKELESITDDSKHTPSVDTGAFPETKTAGYWSSTSLADNPVYAWFVYFNNGYVNPVNKSHEYYTRCVRGGKNPTGSNSTPAGGA